MMKSVMARDSEVFRISAGETIMNDIFCKKEFVGLLRAVFYPNLDSKIEIHDLAGNMIYRQRGILDKEIVRRIRWSVDYESFSKDMYIGLPIVVTPNHEKLVTSVTILRGSQLVRILTLAFSVNSVPSAPDFT